MNSWKDGHSPEQNWKFSRCEKEEPRSSSTTTYSEDLETMELQSQAIAQEKEILYLREQITQASLKESHLLNEKYSLERTFSEMRLALDEKQNEAIMSASNELASRRGDLDVNLDLLNELKVAGSDRYIFTSSMLAILADYGGWPHVTSASALCSSIKNLHDLLEFRIRTSHARLAELNNMIEQDTRNDFVGKEVPGLSLMNGPIPSSSMVHNDEGLLKTELGINRNVSGNINDNTLGRNVFPSGVEQRTTDHVIHPQKINDRANSFVSEDECPGLEGLRIIGDANPGRKLLSCGYTTRGTTLCMFQWVRHYPDGMRQYIEGATNPDYTVTADDVDKLIAVECIPMDDKGKQGELIRIFANDNKKITCDDKMEEDIDTYISQGQATFSVLVLLNTSEIWEPATLYLRRSDFQVKVERTQTDVIAEKYSKGLMIKIPGGFTELFILKCSNGTSYPISAINDTRMRDTIVLTVRLFQSKALDRNRKVKA